MSYENRVPWAIKPDRCALLIHDMQPHYLAALPGERQHMVVSNVRAVATACISSSIPIFASRVPPTRDSRERGLMMEMWGAGPKAGTHDLDQRLGLEGYDLRFLVKRSYSAFFGNDFDVLLRRLDRDAILIVGVYTSIGCYLSAADAFMRDIRAFVLADATADMNNADHATGLRMAARTCARVVNSSAVLSALRR
ncbi:hypothetical protein RSM1_09055 [Methylobacterium radiotolerans]|nr:hypothetical protein RSM1_09055 [Methylobacterium radiotolerans]